MFTVEKFEDGVGVELPGPGGSTKRLYILGGPQHLLMQRRDPCGQQSDVLLETGDVLPEPRPLSRPSGGLLDRCGDVIPDGPFGGQGIVAAQS